MSRTITQSVTSPATYIISTLGPLTTVFTPPPSCTPSTITTNGQRMLAAPSDCMPPNFTPSDDYPTGLAYLNYYSPGICPSGYENAMPIPPALLSPGELGYRCCPSDYSFTLVVVETPGGTISTCASTAAGSPQVWAPEIPIVWRHGDVSTTWRTVTGGDGDWPSSTPTTLSVPTGTQAPVAVAGLSVSAVATVACIGTAVVATAVVLVVLRLRRRRGRRVREPRTGLELNGTAVCELHADVKTPPVELSS